MELYFSTTSTGDTYKNDGPEFPYID